MGLLSPEKLLIVALVIALVFGARGLPGIARRAGKGIRETRDALGIDEIRQEITGVRDTLGPGQATDAAAQSSAPVEPGEPTVSAPSERPGEIPR